MAVTTQLNTGTTSLTVAEGGSGVATMTTAYAPVAAGTTATGALQVCSTGLSTSGFVLTSTGASSLPSFQAVTVPSGTPTTVSVTLNATQFTGMYATPFQIVAAPAAGNVLIPTSLEWMYVYSTNPFVVGSSTNIGLQWGNTVHGGGQQAMSYITANSFAGSAKVMSASIPIALSAVAKSSFDGLGLFVSNQTAALTSGTGSSVIVVLTYITVATGL